MMATTEPVFAPLFMSTIHHDKHDHRKSRRELDPSIELKPKVCQTVLALLDGLPERYQLYFSEHQITDDLLPLLTPSYLQQMGITCVGHQLKILRSIQEHAEKPDEQQVTTASPPVWRHVRCKAIHSLLSGAITMDYLRVCQLSREDAIHVHTFVSTIAAMVWFASVTWAASLENPFGMMELFPEGFNHVFSNESIELSVIHEWAHLVCYVFYMFDICVSAIAVFMGVTNLLTLLHIRDEDYEDFMASVGNMQLRLICCLFLCGMWTLGLAFLIMAFFSIPWPINLAYAVIFLLTIALWWAIQTLGFMKVYECAAAWSAAELSAEGSAPIATTIKLTRDAGAQLSYAKLSYAKLSYGLRADEYAV
jgi:hypothetical protein